MAADGCISVLCAAEEQTARVEKLQVVDRKISKCNSVYLMISLVLDNFNFNSFFFAF